MFDFLKIATASKVFLSKNPIFGTASGFCAYFFDWLKLGEQGVKTLAVYIAFGIALLTLLIKAMDFAERIKTKYTPKETAKESENEEV